MPLACPCGGTPALLIPGETRRRKRQEAEDRFSASTAVAHNAGAARKEYEQAERAVSALAPDVAEIRCPDCGRFVWDVDAHYATALWEKAVAKLNALKPCCQASTDLRVDHDGMVIVRCNECGQRHLPLEPEDHEGPEDSTL